MSFCVPQKIESLKSKVNIPPMTDFAVCTKLTNCFSLQATIGIDFLSKTMYLEDRTVGQIDVSRIISKESLCVQAFCFIGKLECL